MTTQTLTLADFVLARIAEDEAAARDALCDGEGQAEPEPWKAVGWPLSEHPGAVVLIDPARVLAECEARRRIVELRYSWNLQAERNPEPPVGPILAAQVITADAVLRALAQPFADHPDFQPEWRV